MRHQTPIAASELRGKLIQTAPVSVYRVGPAYMAHYAASKAGVVSVTRTAAHVDGSLIMDQPVMAPWLALETSFTYLASSPLA
jgi:NAD(P)-dependent dehydrogenase (short-subunit alcohol dehydrogenase family)